MRPPICEICNERFDPSEGALVSCQPGPDSAAFEARAEKPGFAGHPPHQGWFCARHREVAERAALSRNLRQAVGLIRRSEERSSCVVCSRSFAPDSGGIVTFATTPEGAAWRSASIRGEAEGDPPDRAWFCNRHVRPALRVGDDLTREQALAELMPAGRAPLEYDDRPASADPDRDETRPPLRGPFRPVADGSLDGVDETVFEIAARTPAEIDAELRPFITAVGSAFGHDEVRNGGSTGSDTVDRENLRLGSGPGRVSANYRPYEAGDLAIFGIHLRFDVVDSADGEPVDVRRVLVQQRERSVVDLAITPADPPEVASDGVTMLERIVLRIAATLDATVSRSVVDLVEGFVAGLQSASADPLDPAPDLDGVDLGTGTIERGGLRPGSSYVSCAVDQEMWEASELLVAAVPDYLAALDLDAAPELEHSTRRTWTPMDGAREPDCPFTDHWRWAGSQGDLFVEITATRACWSEGSVSNTTGSLAIAVAGERIVRVSHGQRFDGKDPKASLWLWRPTSAAAVEVTRRYFDRWASRSDRTDLVIRC